MNERSAILNERNFFAFAVALVLALLLIGFSRSFYLLPLFEGPPGYAALEPIFYVHGAVFTSWFVLLGVQTMLVRARNVGLHRKMGLAALALAVLVFCFGTYVALFAANRPGGYIDVPLPPQVFLIVPLSGMAFFAVFVGLGFLNRRHPAAHKRFMFLASLSVVGAAIARIPLMLGSFMPSFETYVSAVLIVMLGVWDYRSLKRVHPVTLWGGLALTAFQLIQVPLAMTAAWQPVARWLMGLAPYG